MTFSATYLEQILRFAALRGVAREQLLVQAGLPSSWTAGPIGQDADNRYPEPVYRALLEGAAQATRDPWFGLHLGGWMNLAAGGLVGQLLHTSASIGEALEHLCAYAALGCEALPLRLERGNTESILILEPDPLWLAKAPLAVRHTEDFFLAFGVRQLEWLHQFQRKPLGIDFRRPEPANHKAAERELGVALRFGRTHTAMRMRSSWLNDPIAYAHPRLLQDLLALAERQLEEHRKARAAGHGQASGATVHAVRQVLFALQGEGFPSLEEVAAKLHCSPRSLQRRLAAEGSSFRRELDQLQDARAKRLLASDAHSVAEVAWLCGYRDAASLTRAFRRRHGLSPMAYRQAQ